MHHRDAEIAEIGAFLDQELLLCALGDFAMIHTKDRGSIRKPRRKTGKRQKRWRLLLSFGLRRRDVFFGYFSIGPGAAQIKKLNFEESNHFDLRRKASPLKYSLMAVIVFLVLIVVTPVGIQLAFMGVGRTRDN
jgi:hypothetical protein